MEIQNAEIPKVSSEKIYALFLDSLACEDLVGADMARKFLQVRYTRATRYANFKGGKKYLGPVPADKKGKSGSHSRPLIERGPEDAEKAEAAKTFKSKWEVAKKDKNYIEPKKEFIFAYG